MADAEDDSAFVQRIDDGTDGDRPGDDLVSAFDRTRNWPAVDDCQDLLQRTLLLLFELRTDSRRLRSRSPEGEQDE